jgi:F-type H+-transporting ATPase subunit b
MGGPSGGGVLDLNVTFVIQLINLLITLVLVNWLLVRPVRAIIAKRRAGCDELTRQTESFVSRAANDAAEYEKALRAAREEGGDARRRAREDALARREAMLAEASVSAADLVRLERESARADSERAGAALTARVDQLADDVVRKLLA